MFPSPSTSSSLSLAQRQQQRHNELIDLTEYGAESLEKMPFEKPDLIKKFIKDHASSFKLPAGLKQLPDWLIDLQSLRRLKISKYEGTRIEVKQSTLNRLKVEGGMLQEIHLLEGSNAYCENVSHDKKIRVHFYNQETGDAINCGAAIGHAYYAAIDTEIDETNFNCETNFPNGQQIQCKHLALQEIIDRQKHAREKMLLGLCLRRVIVRAQAMGQLDRLSQHVHPKTHELFKALLYHAPENYLVGHSQWGKAFQYLFVKMLRNAKQAPSTSASANPYIAAKNILVISLNHAMSLELKVKQTVNKANKRPQFVLSFYDPNLTLTHRRLVFNGLRSLRKCRIETFLASSHIENYYPEEAVENDSEESHANPYPCQQQASLFMVMPDDLHEMIEAEGFRQKPLPASAFMFNAGAKHRSVKIFLSKEEIADPACFRYLFGAGLPLTGLKKQLTQCQTQAERIRRLTAQFAHRAPGLFLALENDCAQVITAFGDIVLTARSQHQLTNDALVNLLFAIDKQSNTPGLFIALQEGFSSSVKAFGKLLLQACSQNWLTDQQMVMLLSAKCMDSEGMPGLFIALENGCTDTIRAFCDIVLEARAHHWITNKQLTDLLFAKCANGVTGAHLALQKGRMKAMQALGKAVLTAHGEGWLTDRQLADWLLAKDADGLSGPFMMLQKEHTAKTAVIDTYRRLLKSFKLGPTVQECLYLFLYSETNDPYFFFDHRTAEYDRIATHYPHAHQAYEALLHELKPAPSASQFRLWPLRVLTH